MRERARFVAANVLGLVLAGLLVYSLAGFIAAPYFLQRELPRYARDALDGEASIGQLSVNPFLLRVEAKDVRLEHPAGRPLAAFRRLSLDFQLSTLFRRAWTFADIQIDGLDATVEIEADGTLNVARAIDRIAKRHADVSSGRETPRRWLVQHVEVRDGKLTFTDRSRATPVTTTFAPINLSIVELTTLPGAHGEYSIAAAVPDGGSISWRGEVTVLPTALSGTLEAKGVKVATLTPFAGPAMRVTPTDGRIDLSARYRFGYAKGAATLALEDIQASVHGVALATANDRAPLVALEAIEVRDGRFDLTGRELTVARVALRNGRVAAILDRDGTINLARLLAPEASLASRAPATDSKARPWHYAVRRLDVEGVKVAFEDRAYDPPIAYDVDIVSAGADALASRGDSPLRFEAALAVAGRGAVKAAGSIAHDFGAADATIEATDIPLEPLRPVITRYAALELASGRASAKARVTYRAGQEGPALSANGAASVHDLLVRERATGDRLLSWKTLSADDVALTLAPNQLAIKEVTVVEPGAKIVISKAGEVNLAQVLKAGAPPARNPGPPAPQTKTATAAPTGQPSAVQRAFTANVSRLRIRNGTVDFADLSLALPFSTRVRRLNGTVVGMSTERASRAELKLDGRIEGSGAAQVEGGLNAFDPKSFTDIRARFDNVEMPPLSPYFATFAGRTIASGRLWLDLRYRVADGVLRADNRVVMQDFTLGERVATPRALDLPLDLAVTLLTDSEGRINVAVPITGNLDNPQFQYGRVLREALATLVTRVVSAPFRALAGLLGSDADKLGVIQFEPGRARLLPPEREKLDKVAQVLRDKPQLELRVRGPYDPRLDGEALRNRQALLDVAQALGVKVAEREDPGPIAYSDAATQRALEGLLAERAGPKAVDEVAQSFRRRTGREPEGVNRLLAVFGKASPDREFYQDLFRRLVDSYPLPESALQELAARRTEVVRNYLAQTAGIDRGRVQAGEVHATGGASDQAVSAELSLGLARGLS
jgi:Domain of Unknown Function (DUF748)